MSWTPSSHCESGRWESWKIVPAETRNWYRQERHPYFLRVCIQPMRSDSQRGQLTPSGQRNSLT